MDGFVSALYKIGARQDDRMNVNGTRMHGSPSIWVLALQRTLAGNPPEKNYRSSAGVTVAKRQRHALKSLRSQATFYLLLY